MSETDYMLRCLELAKRGAFYVAPNPMVGCVIVNDEKIIGEGYHQRCGQAHAEVNAIASVVDKELLKSSTLYVSLEPCSHYGKTPPCADLIVRMGIPRVVIGMADPNPLVAGRGIEILRQAGVEVVVGIEEEACNELNRRFICFQTKKRPYVVLKWAESADGYIDLLRHERGNGPVRISNEITKATNHERRCEEGAIMVATRTALLDNPHLTVTKWVGPNPVRVLLDRHLKVPREYDIYDGEAVTFILNGEMEGNEGNLRFRTLDFEQPIAPQVLEILYREHISSLIVEGGTQLLNHFIEENLWDECQIERAPLFLGSGVKAPMLNGTWIASNNVADNMMSYYRNHQS